MKSIDKLNVLDQGASRSVEAILQHKLISLPHGDITVGAALVFCLIFAVTVAFAYGVRSTVRRLRRKMSGRSTSLLLAERLVFYCVLVAGLAVGLTTIAFNLSSLSIFAGALGVGIGLGIQGVVKEFVSGLTLLMDNVLRIDDFIELPSGVRGRVMEIGGRATCVRTNDSVDVMVPNSQLITDQVINWTRGQHTRRIHVPFGVAYGSDLHRVRAVVLKAARAVEFTLPDNGDQRTQVWLVGFGDSALKFELIVWPQLEAVKKPAAMHAAYTWAIAEALQANQIEVPFPQLDLHVSSVLGLKGEAALQAMGCTPQHQTQRATPSRLRQSSHNDAAADVVSEGLQAPLPDDEQGPAP